MPLKITQVTPLNIQALREWLSTEDQERITWGATVLTFDMGTDEALRIVGNAQTAAGAKHGTRGHPYQSFHAVIRKLEKTAS